MFEKAAGGQQNRNTTAVYYHPVDGYRICVDGDLELNRSLTEVAAVFEKDGLCVSVFKQSAENLSFESYSEYSNQFLNNTIDHTVQFFGVRTIGEREVVVAQWYREPLARIESDKNHYITYDFIAGDAYYSIFVKSSEEITDPAKYDELVASFQLTDAAEEGARVIEVESWRSAPVDSSRREWSDETAAFYEASFGEDAPLRWGIFEPDVVKGNSEPMYELERELDFTFDYLLCYSHFYNAYADSPYVPLVPLLEGARDGGKVVELTLQLRTPKDGSSNMYDILQGEYDAYLKDYAAAIAAYGHPVLFRLNNEMNGDWCPYSAYYTSKDAEIYTAGYRYIYEIFEEAGANRNTVWVWNPNEQSFPNFTWNHTLLYYPGDEYVDIVGMTAYNTGTYYADYGESWKDFTTLYEKLYDTYCTWFAQPFMITEFSCSSTGGDKAAWVEDMFDCITDYPRIKAAVWWNYVDYASEGVVSRGYLLDETPQLVEIFRRRLADY